MSINPGFFHRKQKENKTNRTSYCVAIQFLTNIDRLEGLPGINTRALFFLILCLLSYDVTSFTLHFWRWQGARDSENYPTFMFVFFLNKQFWFVRITFIPAWIKTCQFIYYRFNFLSTCIKYQWQYIALKLYKTICSNDRIENLGHNRCHCLF